ncbi:cytochrome P450 [Aspergillus cavernicola]|uniref:Cytochrome P450 n=1 Tax=Aspergillus cavernicola TaxID=176166 RepID=A0ABR4HS04_9EURO
MGSYSVLAALPWPVVPVLLILAVVVKRRFLSSIRDNPGPFLASISSFWKVQQIINGHIEEEMLALHREHGDFVRVTDNEVSVGHPDAVKHLLHAKIAKGSWYQVFSIPDYRFVSQMSETDPQRHIDKGKNVAAGYALSNIIKSETYVDDIIATLKGQLNSLIESRKPVHLDKWFNYFAFDVVGEVTFSQSFGFVKAGNDIGNAIANARKLALYVSIMGHFVWFHNLTIGNPLMSTLGLIPASHLFDTCVAAIDARKKNPEARNDMMERWLNVRNTHPERMTDAEVFAAAAANVGAGAETVSASLQALIYYLLQNPMYLRRLQNELDMAQVRGELSPVVQYAEAQNLPYLQACIKEAYRYHSSIGTNLPRVVPKGGLTIRGRYFAEGTLLSVNLWVIHRNPDLFGPDSNSFNPERWLDKERAKTMDYFLVHWGAGYNQCPGRNLAHFEINKLAATLIRDYEFERVDPKKEWSFKNHFITTPCDWPCRAKRREMAGV